MNGSYAPVAAAIANVSNIDIFEVQGRRLRGTGGIVPLKYLGGGDGGAFIPQCLENVIANCHSERD